MSIDLLQRPDSDHDDDWKPRHSSDDLEDAYNAPSASDDDLPENHPSRVKDAEETGGRSSADRAEASEIASLHHAAGEPDKAKSSKWKPKSLRGKLKQKKIVALIVTVVMGGSGIGIFSIVSGPLQFIHAAQMLKGFHFGPLEDFGNDRSGRFMYYTLAGKPAKGRLGRIKNNYANRWETRLNNESGLKSVYSRGTQRLIGYEVLDPQKAKRFLQDLEREGVGTRTTLEGTDLDGNRVTVQGVSVQTDKPRVRRLVARTATKSVGLNKVSTFVGSRLHIKRGAVDFHPIKNPIRDKVDRTLEARQKRKEERENQLRTGDPNTPDTPGGARRKASLQKLAGVAKGPALFFGLTCTVKSFNNGIDEFNFENVQALKRVGMSIINIGEQVMGSIVAPSDDMSLAALEELNEAFYDPETGTTWIDDPGIQYEMGQEPTGKDYVAGVKPGSPSAVRSIVNLVNFIPTSFDINPFGDYSINICGSIENIAGSPYISWAFDAIDAVMDAPFRALGVNTPDEYVARLQQWLATDPVNVAARGAERGGLWNVGLRVAVNDQFMAQGGRELSTKEARLIKENSRADMRRELANASFFERYLDIYNAHSLAATTLRSTPRSRHQLIAAAGRLPATFSSFLGNLLGSGKLSAAGEYDYGFPLYGFSPEELDNPDYDDPFANAAFIEDTEGRLARMNQEYGLECFGMQISEEGNLIYGESPNQTKIPAKCKDTSNEELVRYRFYIADMITAHSLACYEGDQDSCRQLGFGAAIGSSGNSNVTLGDLQCPATMEPHPTARGYYKWQEAPNGEYISQASDEKRWGSRELVCATYSVAMEYYGAMEGQSVMLVGNLNTPYKQPSKTHRWGVAVDHSATGPARDGQGIQAASHGVSFKGTYNKEATVLLGKLWADTGMLKNIWWCPPPGDTSLQEIRQYAQSKGLAGEVKCIDGHDDHFHVDLKDEFRLEEYL